MVAVKMKAPCTLMARVTPSPWKRLWRMPSQENTAGASSRYRISRLISISTPPRGPSMTTGTRDKFHRELESHDRPSPSNPQVAMRPCRPSMTVYLSLYVTFAPIQGPETAQLAGKNPACRRPEREKGTGTNNDNLTRIRLHRLRNFLYSERLRPLPARN